MAMAAIDFQLLANAGFPPATYSSGETIFAAGDKGDNMYVIRSGEVEIDGAPRAATAKAKTACEVAPITEKTFLFLVHETPFFAISVMRALADRLRRATPA
jgi:CRP/FNR family transcriptional regulator, cyclic AMP receptor protein